jgi:type III pantothenate kinase
MEKIFTINIGNTHTQYAECENGEIGKIHSCSTEELSIDIVPDSMPVAIASVVPEKNHIFREINPFFVSYKNKTPVDFSLIDFKSMGADRIANAVALAKFAKLPAICIDCGTAITIEAVDSNSVLAGGIIAPGRKLWRKSLNDYTALLPFIETYSERCPNALATDTEGAITSGCDIGILGMAKALINRFSNELGDSECQVIATGGDAEYFASNIVEISFGGADFTLRGIAAIYYENQQEIN